MSVTIFNQPDPFLKRSGRVFDWIVKTAVIAAVSPFMLAGLLSAFVYYMGFPFSMFINDLSSIVTAGPAELMKMHAAWTNFYMACITLVVVARILSLKIITQPVRLWTDSNITQPVRLWIDSKVDSSSKRQRMALVLSPCLLMLVVVVIVDSLVTKPQPPGLISKRPAEATASIVLGNRVVASGKAKVAKQGDGQYLITFTR